MENGNLINTYIVGFPHTSFTAVVLYFLTKFIKAAEMSLDAEASTVRPFHILQTLGQVGLLLVLFCLLLLVAVK